MARDANGKFVSGATSDAIADTGTSESGIVADAGSVEPPTITDAGIDPFPKPGEGGETKRGRGRPRGSSKEASDGQRSKTKPASKKEIPPHIDSNREPLDHDFVTFILVSLHEVGAKILHAKELELTEPEARKLAAATARVADFYDIRMTSQQQAWASFATTAANIYYPRLTAIASRRNEEKKIKAMQKTGKPVV